MTRTTYRAILAILLILWTALVLYGSLAPGDKLPSLNWFARHIPHFDKVVHFGFYAGEVTLFLLLFRMPLWGRIMFVMQIILLSGMIELMQEAIRRSKDMKDLATNALGALAGMLIAAFLNWIVRKNWPRLYHENDGTCSSSTDI